MSTSSSLNGSPRAAKSTALAMTGIFNHFPSALLSSFPRLSVLTTLTNPEHFMKKIILLFVLNNLMAPIAMSGPCDNLYENLSDDLKQTITQLTWVDINPTANKSCQFVIRYYPCNLPIQKQIDQNLPGTIKQAAANCAFVSAGQHLHTEGYCTLDNVMADCSSSG